MRHSFVRASLLISLLTAACGGKKEEPAAPPAPSAPATAVATTPTAPSSGAARVAARDLFNRMCATCHGGDGKGDTPTGKALQPPPRNYTDTAWQASVTDAQLAEVIVKGGAAVGKSPAMPPNPDLESKPEVTAELVKIIRGFAGK